MAGQQLFICCLVLTWAALCSGVTQDVKVKFTRCYLGFGYTTADVRTMTAAMDERGADALTPEYKNYLTCWLNVPRAGIPVMNENGVVFMPRNQENRDFAEQCVNDLPEMTDLAEKAYQVQRCMLEAKFQ